MSFTKNERFIISNQIKILEKLYPAESTYYGKTRKVFEEGFSFECEDAISHIDEELDREIQNEVRDTLDLFSALRRSFDNLPKTTKINEEEIKFRGYDGNITIESSMAGYAEYLVVDEGKFKEAVKGQPPHWGYNSHLEMRPNYQRKIKKWKSFDSKVRHSMSESQIRDVLDA